jgi:uncharacterized protein YcfJ
MNQKLKFALAAAAVAFSAQAGAQVTFYEGESFQGRSFTTQQEVRNLERSGFNDRASSVAVANGRWEVCEDLRFSGRCVVLRPGRYPSLAAMGLNDRVSSVRTVAATARVDDSRFAPMPPAPPPPAQITFYENEGFAGRSFSTQQRVGDFQRQGFNDRASSVVVLGDRWEACEDVRFGGRCVVLRPGRYPSLAAMGLNDRVSSVRLVDGNTRIDDRRYAPPAPVAVYDSRPRRNERMYEANVTSVRAVVGPPEQRCWMEREQVVQERSNATIPGAIAGAVIGGILGHQVGSGRGQSVATVGGAVAGGVVGANVGGRVGGPQAAPREVQRCENVPSQAKPTHWDVTYNFRGQDHNIQTTAPPGNTITVNERGEPRT